MPPAKYEIPPRRCEVCGEMYDPPRSDSVVCEKVECKAARRKITRDAWYAANRERHHACTARRRDQQ